MPWLVLVFTLPHSCRGPDLPIRMAFRVKAVIFGPHNAIITNEETEHDCICTMQLFTYFEKILDQIQRHVPPTHFTAFS